MNLGRKEENFNHETFNYKIGDLYGQMSPNKGIPDSIISLQPYCIGAVVIIIASKTGNWDFGKLKGGDNEFHSLPLLKDLTKLVQSVWHCVLSELSIGHMVY